MIYVDAFADNASQQVTIWKSAISDFRELQIFYLADNTRDTCLPRTGGKCCCGEKKFVNLQFTEERVRTFAYYGGMPLVFAV